MTSFTFMASLTVAFIAGRIYGYYEDTSMILGLPKNAILRPPLLYPCADNDKTPYYQSVNDEGLFHCKGEGPALWDEGIELWAKDGRLHREEGPAVILMAAMWYTDGRLHRDPAVGPALVCGDFEYYAVNGEFVSNPNE